MAQATVSIDEFKRKVNEVTDRMGASNLRAVMMKIAGPESGWNDRIINPRGGAFGAWQFIPSTREGLAAKHSELKGIENNDIFDFEKQTIAMVHFTRENERILKNNFGQDFQITDSIRYLAHFVGPSAASEVLAVDPKTPLKDILTPLAISQNKDVKLDFPGKPTLYIKDFTAGDLKTWASRAMEQPEGYENMSAEARARYRKKHKIPDDTPDSLGTMVMVAIVAVVGLVVALVSGDDSPSPPRTPNGNRRQTSRA